MVDVLRASPMFARIFFGIGFVLEAFGVCSLANRVTMFICGVSLFVMHAAIEYLMSIRFVSNEAFLLVYFVNLPYWVYAGCMVASGKSFAVTPMVQPQGKQDDGLEKVKRSLSKSYSRQPAWLLPVIRMTRRIPFKFFFFMTALMWVVGEQYPFSHYPMYSRMESQVSCAFVTDENGNVLQLSLYFGVPSSQFSKFMAAWKRDNDAYHVPSHVSQWHPLAAQAALQQLYKSARRKSLLRKYTKLQLWEHYLRLLPSGEVFENKQVIAEIDPRSETLLPMPDLGKGNFIPGVDDNNDNSAAAVSAP